jgi:DNA-binding LacI/PurR family transcriptional regulator
MARKSYRSIYELAEQTGVSASTVSRVLNRRGRISQDTRQKVLAAAREARFRPRMSARGTTIAVVMDRMRFVTFGGFVACLLTHVVDELARHSVSVEVFSEHNFNTLSERFVDGVLAMTWDADTVERLHTLQGVPIVLFNRMDVPEFSAVATDHRAGGKMVAQHLLERGHRRIAFLAEERDWGAMERLQGYRNALVAHGLELPDELIAFSQHQPLYGLLPRLMSHEPTALFIAGEDIALESAYILQAVLGVRIPEDVSVVGLENAKVSQFVTPTHTTLVQPLDKMAGEALRILLEQIESSSLDPIHVTLANQLIERDSVRAAGEAVVGPEA